MIRIQRGTWLLLPLCLNKVASDAPQGRSLDEDIACTDGSRWAQLQWDYLSYDERDSWSKLGWTEYTWNAAHPLPSTTPPQITTTFGRRLYSDDGSLQQDSAGDGGIVYSSDETERSLQVATTTVTLTSTFTATSYRPPAESTCYQDLSPVQQDAVRILGYNISTWRACKNPTCPYPDGVPAPGASCLEISAYLDSTLMNMSWVELTPRKHDALMLLGWDANGQLWKDQNWPTTYAQLWSTLTSRQQQAALFLGYNQDVWERCEHARDASCITRYEAFQNKWSKVSWVQLTEPSRRWFQDLGYDEEVWSNGYWPPLSTRAYNMLTPGQIVSVRLVGYVEDTWNHCPQADCRERFEWIQRTFGNPMWGDMTTAQQRAWSLLGQSESLWDAKGIVYTPSFQLTWKELSTDQKSQAFFLGYTEGSWQGCEANWVPSGSNASNVSNVPMNPMRTVRSKMRIRLPFSEVSGNVYGAAVAQLPTSFIQVFETAVARALFCGNPPLSPDPSTYIDKSGNPLCTLPDNYLSNAARINVVSVVEGSIIVDFFITANRTATEKTSPSLYADLQALLLNTNSSLCQDMKFGRFARLASLEEIPFSTLSTKDREVAAQLEKLRTIYTSQTACVLLQDARTGVAKCATADSSRYHRLFGLIIAFFCILIS
jgi:hypothetical protein